MSVRTCLVPAYLCAMYCVLVCLSAMPKCIKMLNIGLKQVNQISNCVIISFLQSDFKLVNKVWNQKAPLHSLCVGVNANKANLIPVVPIFVIFNQFSQGLKPLTFLFKRAKISCSFFTLISVFALSGHNWGLFALIKGHEGFCSSSTLSHYGALILFFVQVCAITLQWTSKKALLFSISGW